MSEGSFASREGFLERPQLGLTHPNSFIYKKVMIQRGNWFQCFGIKHVVFRVKIILRLASQVIAEKRREENRIQEIDRFAPIEGLYSVYLSKESESGSDQVLSSEWPI